MGENIIWAFWWPVLSPCHFCSRVYFSGFQVRLGDKLRTSRNINYLCRVLYRLQLSFRINVLVTSEDERLRMVL